MVFASPLLAGRYPLSHLWAEVSCLPPLVEGEAIELTTANGMKRVFHYAETFAVPAAAGSYTLRNLGNDKAKVIQSFVKESKC
jgi:hypothetical protein